MAHQSKVTIPPVQQGGTAAGFVTNHQSSIQIPNMELQCSIGNLFGLSDSATDQMS